MILMVALKELIRSIHTDISPLLKGKERELYLALKHKQSLKDQEGAELLFPKQKHQYKYFNKVKNDLKRQLRSYLVVLPSKIVVDESVRVFDECYKALVEVKMLIQRGMAREAVSLAKNSLKTALKYDLHKVAFMLAEDLQYYTALYERKLNESEKYDRIAKEQLECLCVENKVRTYYSKHIISLNYSRNMSEEFRKMLDLSCQEFEGGLRFNSTKINIFIYLQGHKCCCQRYTRRSLHPDLGQQILRELGTIRFHINNYMSVRQPKNKNHKTK